jgi:hypothetical protein
MQMNELGFYTLPGAPRSPRDLIDEVRAAEAFGIGACFISERFNIKEAATLSGPSARCRRRSASQPLRRTRIRATRWSRQRTPRRCTS